MNQEQLSAFDDINMPPDELSTQSAVEVADGTPFRSTDLLATSPMHDPSNGSSSTLGSSSVVDCGSPLKKSVKMTGAAAAAAKKKKKKSWVK